MFALLSFIDVLILPLGGGLAPALPAFGLSYLNKWAITPISDLESTLVMLRSIGSAFFSTKPYGSYSTGPA